MDGDALQDFSAGTQKAFGISPGRIGVGVQPGEHAVPKPFDEAIVRPAPVVVLLMLLYRGPEQRNSQVSRPPIARAKTSFTRARKMSAASFPA